MRFTALYCIISDAMHDTPFVGFTAWAQAPIKYGNDDVIIFDGVILNEGQCKHITHHTNNLYYLKFKDNKKLL